MLLPFMSLFIIFTVVPVVMSLPMGFTNFNMIETPKFVGLSNFYTLFLNDDVFLIAVRNTLILRYSQDRSLISSALLLLG